MKPGTWRKEEFGARWRAYRVTTSLLLFALLCSPNVYAADGKLPFDIPAMDFPHAMLDFMHQAHWLTLYNLPERLEHLKTKPILGEYTPAEALALMLKGAPVVFEFHNNGYFSVWGPTEWYPYPRPSMASIEAKREGTQGSWTTATAARSN